MENLSLVEQKAVLTPAQYNVTLANVAAQIANAYVARENDRTAARDAVLLALEIMERCGLQAAPAAATAAPPQAAAK